MNPTFIFADTKQFHTVYLLFVQGSFNPYEAHIPLVRMNCTSKNSFNFLQPSDGVERKGEGSPGVAEPG